MFNFIDKVVIVIGVCMGIGLSVVILFVKVGVYVILVGYYEFKDEV